MVDWWLTPLSGSATHALPAPLAWHGRLMLLGWVVLIPVGALWARFWKVAPGQDWPRELDHKRWWHAHRLLQAGGVVSALAGLALVLSATTPGAAPMHRALGWTTLAIGCWQVVHGVARGSKGGPTAASIRGDHYDMTPRRVLFERVHKSLGWAGVLLALPAVGTGLVAADAPRGFFVVVAAWWLAVAAAFVRWQRRGLALDTYQAIWGPGREHPGNRRAPIGWGVTRRAPPAADRLPDRAQGDGR